MQISRRDFSVRHENRGNPDLVRWDFRLIFSFFIVFSLVFHWFSTETREIVGDEGVSVDLLCRVLADVHADSSKVVDSLLSIYQRRLLGMVYLNDHLNRDKFNGKNLDFRLKSLDFRLKSLDFYRNVCIVY